MHRRRDAMRPRHGRRDLQQQRLDPRRGLRARLYGRSVHQLDDLLARRARVLRRCRRRVQCDRHRLAVRLVVSRHVQRRAVHRRVRRGRHALRHGRGRELRRHELDGQSGVRERLRVRPVCARPHRRDVEHDARWPGDRRRTGQRVCRRDAVVADRPPRDPRAVDHGRRRRRNRGGRDRRGHARRRRRRGLLLQPGGVIVDIGWRRRSRDDRQHGRGGRLHVRRLPRRQVRLRPRPVGAARRPRRRGVQPARHRRRWRRRPEARGADESRSPARCAPTATARTSTSRARAPARAARSWSRPTS